MAEGKEMKPSPEKSLPLTGVPSPAAQLSTWFFPLTLQPSPPCTLGGNTPKGLEFCRQKDQGAEADGK